LDSTKLRIAAIERVVDCIADELWYHDVHKVLEMHSEWEEDIDPELADYFKTKSKENQSLNFVEAEEHQNYFETESKENQSLNFVEAEEHQNYFKTKSKENQSLNFVEAEEHQNYFKTKSKENQSLNFAEAEEHQSLGPLNRPGTQKG
ncbi:hypothetical protein T484DRAFT_1781002, partial [Baffinella frigidus]